MKKKIIRKKTNIVPKKKERIALIYDDKERQLYFY